MVLHVGLHARVRLGHPAELGLPVAAQHHPVDVESDVGGGPDGVVGVEHRLDGALAREGGRDGGGDLVAGHVRQLLVHELGRVGAALAHQMSLQPLAGDALELAEEVQRTCLKNQPKRGRPDPDGRPARAFVPSRESLLLTGEELLDILAAELGAFDDRMADARKHLLEPRADLTLTDLVGAPFDPLGRPVHLALVSSLGRAAGNGDREEHRSDPEPVTFPPHRDTSFSSPSREQALSVPACRVLTKRSDALTRLHRHWHSVLAEQIAAEPVSRQRISVVTLPVSRSPSRTSLYGGHMMITDIASYLRFFDSVRRRTERDIAALPPEAAAWRPPDGNRETGWTIGDIVGHIGSARLYFASAYRGEGWIAIPPELDRNDARTWIRWLQSSADRTSDLLRDTPTQWLTRRIEMIDTPGLAFGLAHPDDDARARGSSPFADRYVCRP